MPERKGRRRRVRRERVRGDARPSHPRAETLAARGASPAPRSQAQAGPLPSTTARVTGLMIAVITAFLAVLMVYQALTGDAARIDVTLRIAAAVALVVLAVIVGVLSVAPGAVRDWVRRRRA